MNQNFSLQTKIQLQRWALLWEKLWVALHWPLITALLLVSAIASGALSMLPPPLPLVIMIFLGGAFLYSLKFILNVKRPSRLHAMRKLEVTSDLKHRETSSLDDQLVAESNQSEIWEEHQRRTLAALDHVKLAAPQSHWRIFDPNALRVSVILAAVAALFLGTGDFTSNFKSAFSLTNPIPTKPVVLDAWLKAPAYTSKAPLLLSSPAMVEKLKQQAEILTPNNSVLNLHIQNATKPHVEIFALGEATPLKLAIVKTESNDQGFLSEITLDRPVTIKVMDGETEVASYPLALIADEAPKISIIDTPKSQGLGQLEVKFKASDDYGVKSVTAEISLADEQEGVTGFEGNGIFLYDAPKFRIALQQSNAKTLAQTATADLSAHAWAGFYAEIVLTATDGAGHKTVTDPKRFKMPEREFSKSLAQALVEQRKFLILSPDAAPDVSTMLTSLLTYPTDIKGQDGLILNLVNIKARTFGATGTDDVVAVVKDLWPLIALVEDGHLSDIRAELEALKQQLEQALRDKASPEKIEELMRKMREAMNKLMEQLQNQSADGSKPEGGKGISPEDLQKMMDKIEQLSKNGSKDAAAQMLAELNKLLQGLKPGQGQQAGGKGKGQGQGGDQEQMDALTDLMGKQQKLMDETQRMGENGKGLGGKQQDLKDQAEKLGKGMGKGIGDSIGDAGKNMGKAKGALEGGGKDEALREQGEAMNKLQEGASKLAEKMAKEGELGQDGQAGNKQDNDPLGRARASKSSPDYTKGKNAVPSDQAIRRAREILEKLRERSNEQGLDETTKAYIDRLLKGLY
jgi:uncharacterized protein (TIGR02302 family)